MWPRRHIGAAAGVSAGGRPAVVCRSESVAAPRPPRHRHLRTRLLPLLRAVHRLRVALAWQQRDPKEVRNRGWGMNRRSSAALGWRGFLADETEPAPRGRPRGCGREKKESGEEFQCGKQDLNLHGITTTRPSTWRVCQFRHSRSGTNTQIQQSLPKPCPKPCNGAGKDRPGRTNPAPRAILRRFASQSRTLVRERAQRGFARSSRPRGGMTDHPRSSPIRRFWPPRVASQPPESPSGRPRGRPTRRGPRPASNGKRGAPRRSTQPDRRRSGDSRLSATSGPHL